MPNKATFLGTVRDVKGSTVSVSMDDQTISGLVFIDGHGYRIGQVGSFVRIPIGYIDLFGIVSQVGAGAVPEQLVAQEPYGYRWLTIQIVGEGYRKGEFKRGVSQYPTVGDEVHLVTNDDLVKIYGRPDSHTFVSVGHIASAESIPALVDVDRLVNRHSAVLGTTGSGKSTTVAGLLLSLSDPKKYPASRIIVFDIHGEYASALKERANIYKINPTAENEKPLFIPYWAMNFEELLAVTFGPLDDMSRGAVLEKITTMKREFFEKTKFEGITVDSLTVDTPIPFSIHQLWFDLHCEVNATHHDKGKRQGRETWALEIDSKGRPIQEGDPLKVIPPKFRAIKDIKDDPEKIRLSQSPLNIRRHLEGLASKLRDPRFDFLFKPGPWCPESTGKVKQDLDLLLKDWIGGEEPVSILDLSGVPIGILTNLIGVLLRIIYDALFWARELSEGGRERPLLVVLEEAHSYLGTVDSGPAAFAVKRIVKEGRKYGIGAMIVSQRPAEIDPTILSQCGTLFALRLSNQSDRSHVTGAATDNLEGLFSLLPILRTGEAIIVGEAVQLPVRALISPPLNGRFPDSKDPLVYNDREAGGWNRARGVEDYEEVVAVWRKQDPKSPRTMTLRTKGAKCMQRQAVVSSDIAEIGYEASSLILQILFVSGGLYNYFDVPASVHETFMQADSKGRFFNGNIKSKYRYAKA